ncbi:flagella basal body P-ring formation protein FlgA [Sulfurivirga caldicuralii]|uniref:Flagella basal body P-ring formation protein FlgA n=1 Tax=Sulfurivirga caldicuralii TaxID=364032 RepID=A0A1N6E5B6_9GAMM|nr:flagellar basal body P-ring formation chaperone FlgA [Sulfurivirga caldicuralii]SIN78196.1 flagella basal body P-ring formation protein FlgA [Sulfurivirga caldicuralii]
MQPLHNLLLLTLLTLLTPAVWAAEPFQDWSPAYEQLANQIKQKIGQDLINPKISIQPLGKRTRLPACKTPVSIQLPDNTRRKLTGRFTALVRCNEPHWKVFISYRISGQRPVMVSTTLIPRMATIKADMVAQRLIDASQVPRQGATQPDQVIGKRARRAIAAGQIITAQMLLPPYWVFRNKPVILMTRIGTIEIRTKGIALRDAVENEVVEVRNLRSGRKVRGMVIAPNTVLVP